MSFNINVFAFFVKLSLSILYKLYFMFVNVIFASTVMPFT